MEALARFPGLEGATPETLFQYARSTGKALEIDRKCRIAALAGFREIPADSGILLFMNLDSEIFRPEVIGSNHLINAVREYGIPPEKIIIEILENRAENLDSLKQFVDTYRSHGFLIAIDDIGSEYSNLNRISIIKPDVIKLDRFLVSGINNSHHKKAVVNSLVELGQRIGALIVGEGIERQEEAFTLMELGVDLFQGFHYCRPMEPSRVCTEETATAVEIRMNELRRHSRERVKARQEYLQQISQTTRNLRERMSVIPESEKKSILEKALQDNSSIIAAYTLDSNGIQTSPTVGKEKRENRQGLFSPAREGTDQSLKPYYLNLQYSTELYISEPYISLADGRVCRTCSANYLDITGKPGILCVDYNSEQDMK